MAAQRSLAIMRRAAKPAHRSGRLSSNVRHHWDTSVDLLPALLPVASGLAGVLIGAWLSGRRDRSQRRLAFVEKQLAAFYSPMLGIREEILAVSLLRARVQEEADKASRDLNNDGGGRSDP